MTIHSAIVAAGRGRWPGEPVLRSVADTGGHAGGPISPPTPPRLLIVEDNGLLALDMRLSLEGRGFIVSGTAGSGEEAVEMAASERPDLILMDVNLGRGIDGVEAARRIRQSLDVPVIFVTAYSDAQTVARIEAARPNGLLFKPIVYEELQQKIAHALASD